MDHVQVLRRFNRSFTQRIGVLDDSYLGTGRPLGPSRILYEIGPEGLGVAVLRRRLGLDSGYLSRLLRQLEGEGLVEVRRDPADGRQRIATLTPEGRRDWLQLDERAELLAHELVSPLSDRLLAELTEHLARAERLLAAATVGFEVVDPQSPQAEEALARYFGELDQRFSAGFDAGPGGTEADGKMLVGPDGAFVVMTSDESVIGCGGVQRVADDTAEIKRMWVHADWRSLGLGRRLLARLEEQASELGRSRVVLDTNESLREAIAMYERAGYHPIERYNDNPYAHHWFAKVLAE